MSISSRRNFIKKSLVAASVLPFSSVSGFGESPRKATNIDKLNVSIFSKHLQFLDYKETGAMAAELGFDGVDLTVRPKGHVFPENVRKALPSAIKEIQSAGSNCQMITTAIESATNPHDVQVIRTAAENGVEFYRTNWYKYPEDISMADAITLYQHQVSELAKINEAEGIVGCYQNHAGTKVGASYWEVYKLIETADPNFFGVQYDIRHATVDGGLSWTNGLKLLQNRIKVIALKDFKWGKVGKQWKPINVPIGEGMVDFDKYFKCLKAIGVNPPVSLHLEYALGGAEKGNFEITVDRKVVYDAMRKDLQAIQNLWANA